MTTPLTLGRYRIEQDRAAALALRALCFRGGGSDEDSLDATCQHWTVRDGTTGETVAAFRALLIPDAAGIGRSYSARFYDLSRLAALSGPFLELGRFCLHPDRHDPDILRLAWAGLTRIVDGVGVQLLFGCSSFHGTDPAPHSEALAQLSRHIAPPDRAPQRKAEALDLPTHAPDPKRAAATMPPLLRSYLAMGAWVSDHAVIDRDLNTLHVCTGVEIAAIPPARARLLRALAQPVPD